MNKLEWFFEVLNNPNKYPLEKELAQAAIDATDELNALRAADAPKQEPSVPVSKLKADIITHRMRQVSTIKDIYNRRAELLAIDIEARIHSAEKEQP